VQNQLRTQSLCVILQVLRAVRNQLGTQEAVVAMFVGMIRAHGIEARFVRCGCACYVDICIARSTEMASVGLPFFNVSLVSNP